MMARRDQLDHASVQVCRDTNGSGETGFTDNLIPLVPDIFSNRLRVSPRDNLSNTAPRRFGRKLL